MLWLQFSLGRVRRRRWRHWRQRKTSQQELSSNLDAQFIATTLCGRATTLHVCSYSLHTCSIRLRYIQCFLVCPVVCSVSCSIGRDREECIEALLRLEHIRMVCTTAKQQPNNNKVSLETHKVSNKGQPKHAAKVSRKMSSIF